MTARIRTGLRDRALLEPAGGAPRRRLRLAETAGGAARARRKGGAIARLRRRGGLARPRRPSVAAAVVVRACRRMTHAIAAVAGAPTAAIVVAAHVREAATAAAAARALGLAAATAVAALARAVPLAVAALAPAAPFVAVRARAARSGVDLEPAVLFAVVRALAVLCDVGRARAVRCRRVVGVARARRIAAVVVQLRRRPRDGRAVAPALAALVRRHRPKTWARARLG